MARKLKSKLYILLDETFYPERMEFGTVLGYVSQVSEDAAVREFLALNPKLKHGSEVIAIECQQMGCDTVRDAKRWLKENIR